ncbi:MAG: hypothetical protein AB8B99_14910 [Phormidesmis sp.]
MEALVLEALKIVVSGIAAGATGKLGEPLGEGVIAATRRLVERLQLHSPETVQRLEGVSDPAVIEAEIVEEVTRVAAERPEVKAALEETVVAAAADSDRFPQLTKLAEKIGVVNLEPVTHQTNHITL